jgi:hypothetical protein
VLEHAIVRSLHLSEHRLRRVPCDLGDVVRVQRGRLVIRRHGEFCYPGGRKRRPSANADAGRYDIEATEPDTDPGNKPDAEPERDADADADAAAGYDEKREARTRVRPFE